MRSSADHRHAVGAGGNFTRQLAAMVGAIVVGGLVFGVAWGKRMSPVTLILARLVLPGLLLRRGQRWWRCFITISCRACSCGAPAR